MAVDRLPFGIMAEATRELPKFAFQCKHCGAVEPAEAAGENALPRACHACRHGMKFEVHPDGTGFSMIDQPENWIVLADLTEKELAADFHRHGLKPDRVTRHKPPASNVSVGTATGKTVIATAEETPGIKDKAGK